MESNTANTHVHRDQAQTRTHAHSVGTFGLPFLLPSANVDLFASEDCIRSDDVDIFPQRNGKIKGKTERTKGEDDSKQKH